MTSSEEKFGLKNKLMRVASIKIIFNTTDTEKRKLPKKETEKIGPQVTAVLHGRQHALPQNL